MNIILSIFGYIFGAACVACLLAIIWASFLENTTRWYFCVKCMNWHNNHGDKQARTPHMGALDSEDKCCKECGK